MALPQPFDSGATASGLGDRDTTVQSSEESLRCTRYCKAYRKNGLMRENRFPASP